MEDSNPIVIDLGSGWSKAGFAGEETPRVVFPTVVGRPKSTGVMLGPEKKDTYIGDEVLAKQNMLTLSYPIQHGSVTNWGDLVKILQYSFYDELSAYPEEQAVLITTAPLTSKPDLEKLTQILFETFNVPAAAIVAQASLALAATGRTTGIVLDVGNGFTQAVPIVDRQVVWASVGQLNLAGSDLTTYLVQLLREKGVTLTTAAERNHVNDIKEKLCYVAFDFAIDMATAATNGALEKVYELPNGSLVTLGTERFRCPEALFQPALIGQETDGIHTLLYQSIMQCEANLRPALFANIVLAGGTTLLPGLPERLKKELTALAPGGTNVEIIAPPARNHLAWLGGASLAASPTWQTDRLFNRQAYDDAGPSIVHRKFF